MDGTTAAEVAFMDVRFYENETRTNDFNYKTKVMVNKNDGLRSVLEKAVQKLLEKNNSGEVGDDTVDSAIKRIKRVTCNSMDLFDFIDSPEATLGLLNSSDSPIFAKGLDIYLPRKVDADNNNAHEPMVELKQKYDGVEFWGQDDKAKIPIGEQVHVSTGTVSD